MSNDKTPFDDAERDNPMLAAEHALGLLEGEELAQSRAKLENDPEYRWRKDWWNNWFAPWTDEVSGAEPSDVVWVRISEAVAASQRANAADTAVGAMQKVVSLEDRLKRWQWAAGITSAAAAIMLAVMVFAPGSEPGAIAPSGDGTTLAASDPLVAQVPIGDTGLRLDVTYIPQSEQLLVGAIGLTADGVHDHELWLVPDDGSALQSLGVVQPGEVLGKQLPADIIANMGDGAELVLTREPIGGKPVGEDAGPVVAQGAFSKV